MSNYISLPPINVEYIGQVVFNPNMRFTKCCTGCDGEYLYFPFAGPNAGDGAGLVKIRLNDGAQCIFMDGIVSLETAAAVNVGAAGSQQNSIQVPIFTILNAINNDIVVIPPDIFVSGGIFADSSVKIVGEGGCPTSLPFVLFNSDNGVIAVCSRPTDGGTAYDYSLAQYVLTPFGIQSSPLGYIGTSASGTGYQIFGADISGATERENYYGSIHNQIYTPDGANLLFASFSVSNFGYNSSPNCPQHNPYYPSFELQPLTVYVKSLLTGILDQSIMNSASQISLFSNTRHQCAQVMCYGNNDAFLRWTDDFNNYYSLPLFNPGGFNTVRLFGGGTNGKDTIFLASDGSLAKTLYIFKPVNPSDISNYFTPVPAVNKNMNGLVNFSRPVSVLGKYAS